MKKSVKKTSKPDKLAELEKKFGKLDEVTVYEQADKKDPCVIYFKPASTYTKMQCMDVMAVSKTKAGQIFLEATLVKEISDVRVLRKDNDEDTLYIAAVLHCVNKLQASGGYIKKK
jgi:hypothetical protein